MFVLKTALSTLVTLLAACDSPEGSLRASAEPSTAGSSSVVPAPAAPVARDLADTAATAPETSGARAAGASAPTAEKAAAKVAKHAAKTIYVCPMHPEVTSEKPGLCPKCNMKLEPKPAAQSASHDAHDHAGPVHGGGSR